jgi:hypothetical protein
MRHSIFDIWLRHVTQRCAGRSSGWRGSELIVGIEEH